MLTCLCSPSLAETSNNKDLAETLWDDGLKYFRIYDYETAIQKFNNSLELYNKIGDKQSEVDVLTWIGETKGRMQDANFIEYFRKAQNICETYDLT